MQGKVSWTRDKPLTKREQVIDAATRILSDGTRRTSRELLSIIELVVDIGGKDPAAALASYLSHEKDLFESDLKKGGWTLRRLTKKVRPDDAGTSSGLFNN
jgi:hypothetical protein